MAPTGRTPVAPPPTSASAAIDFSPSPRTEPSGVVPIAACAIAIVSGWATSVVATDLVASWWQSDRLFCVAVTFLSLVFAATTVAGVILLLRRRWLGAQLIAIGALVALLTFGSLFIAGAHVPWIVHLIPVVQIASAALALHPATRRWLAGA
nr:hypothetical protein [Mycolicibacter acidiphilus]